MVTSAWIRALVLLVVVLLVAGAAAYVLRPKDEPLPTFNEAKLREMAVRLGVPVDRPEEMPASGPGSYNATRELSQHLGMFPMVRGDVNVRLAQEVLNMMERAPGLERYTVSVNIKMVRYSLTAEVTGNALIRIEQAPERPPVTVVYRDYLQSRLKDAAQGGDLKNTPEGVKPGMTMSSSSLAKQRVSITS